MATGASRKTPMLTKLGINSQFVPQYQLRRNSFLQINASRDSVRTMLQFLTAAVTLLAHPLLARDALPSAPAAPSSTQVIAPREYDWTFFYRQHRYGVQQYGPVATYRRNTLLIWRSQAHLILVTVPGLVAIVGIVAVLPFGLWFWSGVRHRRRTHTHAARCSELPINSTFDV
jgi:hypothetical protein